MNTQRMVEPTGRKLRQILSEYFGDPHFKVRAMYPSAGIFKLSVVRFSKIYLFTLDGITHKLVDEPEVYEM